MVDYIGIQMTTDNYNYFYFDESYGLAQDVYRMRGLSHAHRSFDPFLPLGVGSGDETSIIARIRLITTKLQCISEFRVEIPDSGSRIL